MANSTPKSPATITGQSRGLVKKRKATSTNSSRSLSPSCRVSAAAVAGALRHFSCLDRRCGTGIARNIFLSFAVISKICIVAGVLRHFSCLDRRSTLRGGCPMDSVARCRKRRMRQWNTGCGPVPKVRSIVLAIILDKLMPCISIAIESNPFAGMP